MSALCVAASAHVILSASITPLATTGYPFSLGMWVNLTAVGASARMLWSISDTGTTNNYLGVRMNSTEQIAIVARGGGTENVSTAVTPILTAGTWAYFVGRFISATNRVIHALGPGGFSSAQTTTNRAPTGLDFMSIGCLNTSGGFSELWDGMIAEYWLANADCFPTDNATGLDPLVHKLAYGGPLAFPGLSSKLIEYRSFRRGPGLWVEDNADMGEFFRGDGIGFWSSQNGIQSGPAPHPPLPYWYKRKTDISRLVMV
jgi:hypothetical protein